ncbi:MAG TPA: DUF4287 domain-containing protein [Planctomycetia bacterium]|nr:DUF4287 domain-containing protein [Planctomycetia bacterium]
MGDVDKAISTQLANIEKRTGKKLAELVKIVRNCGYEKHGEIRDYLKERHAMGHGDANTLVHYVSAAAAAAAGTAPAANADPLDAIYVGAKAGQRPIHEKLMAAIGKFGPFEVAPKKGYVSLRRKKQFAMLGPATNAKFEVGLNYKGWKPAGRLEALPEKSMCQYRVRIESPDEADAELMAWIKAAYDAAG